jgi:hypothetical protein
LGRATVLVAYTLTITLFASEVAIALVLKEDRAAATNLVLLFDNPASPFFLVLIFVMTLHYGLMLQTLTLAAHSMTRELQANNWEMLILTGVDARKIVWGKWWATVQRMWRSYGRLALLRAMLIGWLGAWENRSYALSMTYYLYGGSPDAMVVPTIPHFLLSAFFVVALTMANLPFTAACGVSAFSRHEGMGRARAVATRLGVGSGILISLFALIAIIPEMAARNFFQSVIFPAIRTFADNGVGLGTDIVRYHVSKFNFNDGSPYWLPTFLLSLGIYVLLTLLMLHFAQWQAVRSGALPPVRRPIIKID